MNNPDQSPALLPSGFADLLPPEAQQEADAITMLMQEFTRFGYSRVKPPLAEFEDSLLGPGPGAALAGQTFRLMDPVSHRMLGLRSDITAQIARIASSRLASAPRPLRLTYANDVLRTKGSQQRTERQFCQVGCEIIGRADDEADIEICVVALIGLSALRIKAVTLDLALPRLVDHILDEAGVAAADRAGIRDALARRDVAGVQKLAGKAADVFTNLLKESGPADKALAALEKLKLSSADARRDVAKLKSVYEGVMKAIAQLGLTDVSVTIDPVEHKGFEYYSGIGFNLFAAGQRGELGGGGRYNVTFGGRVESETATGFTLYMDTVRHAMVKPGLRNIVFVSVTESWDTMRALQDDGWAVIRGGQENSGIEQCTHEYRGGKVHELKKAKG